ncbi:MAG: T9SS type A sorting domain-containing protein [Burkholderiales bacterium]|nr:T9SS type A sorting domain-containing protein [Bacteroidia bacterium]
MRKLFLCTVFCCFTMLATSQNKNANSEQNQYFDEKAAIEQCISKGMKTSEIKGYVQFLKNDFSSKTALAKQNHKHTPYENSSDKIQETVIYLNPNKTSSASCPNMGFEQLSFSSWTGSYGMVSTGNAGSGFPTYSQTSPTIVNTAGNNVSLVNTINYHTIMTTAATNPVYPNCTGYDSIACKVVGTNTISQIPVVSPFSLDGASVRMNGANPNYRGCKLKYITTTSATNKKLSYSFALVLYNGGHTAEESPYFKVEVKNESTGALLTSCNSSAVFNVTAPLASDSIFTSPFGFNDIMCRKWRLYTIDLSSLPLGSNVSVNFEVAGCSQGGHWGYAYVDAECGATGSGGGPDYITSNMCSGSTTASLIAPLGYTGYQWLNPSSNPIAGATSNTLSVSNPTVGNIYSVQLTGSNGCVETKTVTVATSSITITNISATGTCLGGNLGSATVNINGGNGAISYTWTSISTGSVISNNPTAVNLSPGNYSVNISSGTCGQSSATVTVPVSAPAYYQQTKTYCGNNTFISTNIGTNYQWYMGTTPIPAPNGTSDTLSISNPINGSNYTVVYTNAGNCRDSIRYIINQVAGGSIYINNIANVCPGNSNGSVVLNLSPINPSPYSYSIKDISNNVVSNATNSSTTYSVINLSAGTYTSTVNDGNCTYNNIFIINAIQTSFTMTGANTSSCSPSDTARINFNFGAVTPSVCALSSSGNCTTPNAIQIGNGTAINSNTSYPAIYSNWYKNARHQLLYRASELQASGVQPGKLSSISFNISSIAGTTVYPNFTIKMKCTTVNDLFGASFDNSGLTQVYSSPSVNINTGWNTYQFPTAYEWDGVSNILIDVCSDLTTNYTNNSSSPYTVTSFGSVLYFNNDVTVACMTTNVANSSPNRPNIIFENCGSTSPSSYTISVSSNGAIVQNSNNTAIKVVPAITPTTAIVYTITITNPQGGCTASQTYTMSSGLSAVATASNASCGSCANGAVQVTTNCGTGPYTYSWSPGGATTQSVSGLLPGCYTVTITDSNSNSAMSVACVSFSTKLEEVSETNGLIIYPNPGNGIFNLLSNDILNKIDIIVFNPLGQSVFSESFKTTKDVTVDISKLSKGIYYLKATTDNGSKLFKLILE